MEKMCVMKWSGDLHSNNLILRVLNMSSVNFPSLRTAALKLSTRQMVW